MSRNHLWSTKVYKLVEIIKSHRKETCNWIEKMLQNAGFCETFLEALILGFPIWNIIIGEGTMW